jgi:hypothetical protein
MLDTTAEQQDRYYAMLSRLSPETRAKMTFDLSRLIRQLALSGIRLRHPSASDEELKVRLAVRLYGREIAKRLFGVIPRDAR